VSLTAAFTLLARRVTRQAVYGWVRRINLKIQPASAGFSQTLGVVRKIQLPYKRREPEWVYDYEDDGS
jgi:hypothetical protein